MLFPLVVEARLRMKFNVGFKLALRLRVSTNTRPSAQDEYIYVQDEIIDAAARCPLSTAPSIYP